jgi:predicted permease
MNWIRRLFSRRQLFDDLSAEIRAHLEERTDELSRSGLTEEDAAAQARREFGNVTLTEERAREIWQWPRIESFFEDVRFGLRTLRKSPGFTTVAVLTLALGIGANTAIFSLTDQILLERLPVGHPEQLALLSSTEAKWGRTHTDYDLTTSFSYPMYKDLRDHNEVFSGLLTCFPVEVSVVAHGSAQIAHGELVSGNFFSVLGARPTLGRVFSSADETVPGANPVTVLNYAYWTEHFGGDRSILNQTVNLNGFPFTIVGVARPGFNMIQAGAKPDVYVPITMKAQMTPGWNGLADHSDYFLPIVGRLEAGITLDRAEAGLQPLFHDLLRSEFPEITSRWGATVDLKHFLAGQIELSGGEHGRPVLQHSAKSPLLFLSAMVGLVLLIACANLASLLLARGESRHHEVAVRLALGAGHSRIIRQLLTESTLVAVAGGAAGLFMGWSALRALLAAMPADPGTSGLSASLNLPVLTLTAAVAIGSGILCGLFPAISASRTSLQSAFNDQARSTAGGIQSTRVRKSLIVTQVAMTATLLVAAGLFGESLVRTERVNLGMHIDHIVQFDFLPGLSRYSAAQTLGLFDRLRQKLAALPGVTSVTASESSLLAGGMEIDTVNYEGYRPSGDDENEGLNPWVNYIEPRFFSTLGVPLLKGREFRDSDTASSPAVAIISESVARKFFAGRNPIGLHLGFGGEVPRVEIVGVVGDVRQNDPRWPASPSIYFPCAQDKTVTDATFYVRTPLESRAILATLRNSAAQVAPDVAASNFRTLTEQLNNIIFDERLVTFLTIAFGLLAAALASVGVYGVMAYIVARRTREIGIRMALGAKPGKLAGRILWQAGGLALAGIVIGFLIAVPISRLIRAELFEVKPQDPVAFLISAVLLAAVALAACYIPARRAMRVDPMVALKYE